MGVGWWGDVTGGCAGQLLRGRLQGRVLVRYGLRLRLRLSGIYREGRLPATKVPTERSVYLRLFGEELAKVHVELRRRSSGTEKPLIVLSDEILLLLRSPVHAARMPMLERPRAKAG